MRIRTSSGFEYTYNSIDNSIVDGFVDNIQNLHVKFKPLEVISDLPNISAFTIGVTEQCNFRCTYCCYSGQYKEHRKHSPRRLSSCDIKPIMDFMVKHSCQDLITVDFYGGESLLELDWIRSFVNDAKAITNKKWQFEISTNGYLLKNEVIDWLVENDFKVFISIDGINDYHDRYRKDVNGHNTFSTILCNLKYIKEKYESYWYDNVKIMMTVQNIAELPDIAEQWVLYPLFRDKMPFRISEVATIYNSNTVKVDYDTELKRYMFLVDWFKNHPDNGLMKTFFNTWLAEWIGRPLVELDQETDYPTCIPHNRKLYIDASGNVGICERITDTIRIGSLTNDIDFNKVNGVANLMSSFVDKNCSTCEIARVCDLCPDVLKISEEIRDVYCHNQKVLQKIKFRCFCELAEAEMI